MEYRLKYVIITNLLRLGHAQRNMGGVEVLHVVAALHVFHHVAATGGAEGFNRVDLILLHLGRLAAPHDRHTLTGVDLEGGQRGEKTVEETRRTGGGNEEDRRRTRGGEEEETRRTGGGQEEERRENV